MHSMHSTERGINRTLQQIAEYIEDTGRSLEHFGLPQPQLHSPEVTIELEAFEHQLDILRIQASVELMSMNLEQQHVFYSIYNNIRECNSTKCTCNPIFVKG